jgi:hypothetical protein
MITPERDCLSVEWSGTPPSDCLITPEKPYIWRVKDCPMGNSLPWSDIKLFARDGLRLSRLESENMSPDGAAVYILVANSLMK